MRAVDAMRLIGEELVLDGIPMRNLATFVTTWMEPEAQRIIAENLHRNFIDHAEYPQTAEIEQRCIRMLADLFHAPGETTGARTQGSSEAIMLGALSLKWKWRQRREAAGKDTDRPNLVFGGDVHVVWEKFCRYFDVEPRIIPLQPRQVHDRPRGRRAARRREHDRRRGRAGHDVHRARRRHRRDQRPARRPRATSGLDVPLHVDGASGGFVWPFLYPDTEWDFRLEQVRSINVVGPQVRARVPRDRLADLPRDAATWPRTSSSTRTTSARRDATFTLNFSTGSAMVLAQYYNFVRFGHDGLPLHHGDDAGQRPQRSRSGSPASASSGWSAPRATSSSRWWPSSSRASTPTTSSTSPWQLAAERGWMVPAYTLPPNADHVTIMRALVKLTLGHTLVETLADDIAEACEMLAEKGGLHEHDRKRVKTGVGY